MFELIALGIGFWIGFYWGRHKSLPPVIDDIKDEILSEEEKAKNESGK